MGDAAPPQRVGLGRRTRPGAVGSLSRGSADDHAGWPDCVDDRSYCGDRVGSAIAITVEIVEHGEGQTGFAVQPRRWVIERTFGWIGRCLWLDRDPEATASSALAFFVLAAAMILVRRLACTI